jgi:8-oxo-dGTP pyrophosphatase MutT (NUDIX family)
VSGDQSSDIRFAATIIVAREGGRGPELLLLRRTARHRFLPGFLVFPGGAVDPGDARLAERWFGDAGEAPRACAVRELAEEAGLAVTGSGVVEGGIADLDADPPAATLLRGVSHWIAPEDVPVRFDARFYAVEAPRGLEARPDGIESDLARWSRPADLLEASASGGCSLYWPTMKVIEALAACSSVADVLAADIPQTEPDVQTVG